MWLTILGYSPLWAGGVKTLTQVADPITHPRSRVEKHKYMQSYLLDSSSFPPCGDVLDTISMEWCHP